MFEIVEIGADDGTQIGVDDGGAAALEFADLRQHIKRDAQRHMREFGIGDLLHQLLVHRVGVGVHQADRDGVNPGGVQFAQPCPHVGGVERDENFALGVDTFGQRQPAITRHQRRRFFPEQIVDVAAPATAADFQNIDEPRGGEQAHLRPGGLQHGVGGNRGAMHETADAIPAQPLVGEYRAERLDDAAGEIVRRGQELPAMDTAVFDNHDQIGKGAAGIDADAETLLTHRQVPRPIRQRQRGDPPRQRRCHAPSPQRCG